MKRLWCWVVGHRWRWQYRTPHGVRFNIVGDGAVHSNSEDRMASMRAGYVPKADKCARCGKEKA